MQAPGLTKHILSGQNGVRWAESAYPGRNHPNIREKRALLYRNKSPEDYDHMEEKLLDILKQYKLTGANIHSSKVIIQSFSPESLQIIHNANPNIPLVQLLWYDKPAAITDAELNNINLTASDSA